MYYRVIGMDQASEIEPLPAAYQVFISHRGPDVKNTLASLIYHRLTNCGLAVFLDKNEIHAGDSISPAISAAIHSASVYIVIFSKGFADSRWCLEELYWILRSHHKRRTKIIPVFFDVEPAELRHIESGCYAKAFENHRRKGRVTIEAIEKWKTALNEASIFSGKLLKTNESDQGEFLEEIAKIVLKGVFELEHLEYADHPVGLEEAAEDFENEILKESHSNATMVVGIAGMPGVGKSTLARHLYHLKRPDFSRSSFLYDVRKRDLLSLQKQLLRDLVGCYDMNPFLRGKSYFRKCLRNSPRIFVVLDGVDHMNQIDCLLDTNAVASGSLILITSTDKDLLKRSSAKTIIYDVKMLNRVHARELFCRHAFPESKPSEGFEDIVEGFSKICGGLPLSLKVLGGLFVGQSDKEKSYWERQLEKLSTTLPDDIIKPLEVSYKALDPVEKQVFLDVGCFLVGEEKELALRVLDGLYENNNIGDCLENLRQKCLVDFHYDASDNKIQRRKCETPIRDRDDIYDSTYGSYKIKMHDQLRELARNIARQEFRVYSMPNPVRLSSSNDILEMFRSQVGSHFRIRGIRSSEDKIEKSSININVEGMHILVIENFKDLSSFLGSWDICGELVWLRLRNVGSFHIPRSISLTRLKVLEIEGAGHSIEELFDNFDQYDFPTQLNELIVTWRHTHRYGTGIEEQKNSATQRRFDKNISGQRQSSIFHYVERNATTALRMLTKLVVKNLKFLHSLPIDFSQLQNLRHLNLSGCINLTELPNTFSQLLQLQYLSLQRCHCLSIPLDILGEISTLEYVDLKGCEKLVALPLGTPYQMHLRYLNLLRTGLLQLPDNFEMLDELKQLLIGSPELRELPHSLAKLRGLTVLILSKCNDLELILAEGIAAPNIKVLAISDCPHIANFIFQDGGCIDVENIHLKVGMSFLRDFTLKHTSISEICIPEGVLPRIETIDLSRNSRLMKVDALPSALVKLDLSYCTELRTLTALSNLVNLKLLSVCNCDKLDTLDVRGLILLQEIEAEKCWKLKRIEGLSECGRLNCLNISTNTKLIWNDICKFLISSSHGKLSTANINAIADAKSMLDEEEMCCILGKFKTKTVDMVSSTTTSGFHVKLENFHSHSAILICVITYTVRSLNVLVQFKASNCSYGRPDDGHFIRFFGEGGERRLHIVLVTDDSDLFRDYKEYSDIDLSCYGAQEEEFMQSGWIVMVDEEKDVLEVCKEMITAFA